MMHGAHDEHDHDDHGGLGRDLAVLTERRRALKIFAGAGLAALVGCASSGKTVAGGTTTSSTAAGVATTTTAAGATTTTSNEPIPEETAGPYPGDGSNGPDVLNQDGVVRSDITSSFGSASGVADGVGLTVKLTIVDAGSGSPMKGAAVYVWHCDQQGRYSLYSQGITAENYLRGVQVADAAGIVSFKSIYPACYSGRWPHIHYEVYESLDAATSGGTPRATSQLAMPDAQNTQVFATAGYEQSVRNYSQISLSSDMVFSDGADRETPAVTGTTDGGFTAALTVPV